MRVSNLASFPGSGDRWAYISVSEQSVKNRNENQRMISERSRNNGSYQIPYLASKKILCPIISSNEDF
jgi:hypothetical protein